jgi:HD-GYP domain-containing protein (c-di-GMP phosphodiesterase class II)
MIKKISVALLRPGMFVSDFNAGWLNHPFLTNSILISDEHHIQQILSCGLKEVFIDTERGLDSQDAPTAAEAETASREALIEQVASGKKPVEPKISVHEEMRRARSVFSEATRIIHSIMEDIRLGRQLDVADNVRLTVEKMASSVVRNNAALITMRRLKHHDDYTFLHSVSVCTMLLTFCQAAGLEKDKILDVAMGALLHDIGKMRVDSAVLNKQAKLSDDEFRHMKSHVMLGSQLLRQIPDIPELAFEPLEQHHERYDGGGYPRGLKGEEISRIGRMAAIVDVYDAITSDRCYHKGMNPAAAMQKLFEWSKYHFDPGLVQMFIKVIGIYPVGSLVRLESGRLGLVIEQRETSPLTPVVRVIYDARHGHYVWPEDLDLSKPLGQGGGDRIVGFEQPKKWQIDTVRFMPH